MKVYHFGVQGTNLGWKEIRSTFNHDTLYMVFGMFRLLHRLNDYSLDFPNSV